MSEDSSLGGVVERILDGRAPKQVRSAAARGALPLPRAVLVRLYLVLRGDEDQDIRVEAENSLACLGRESLLDVLGDAECPPEVLGHFADQAVKDEAMAERITFHRSAPDGALATLAAGGTASVIDLVLTNQERLLRQPDLLNCLSVNPALRVDQRGRILELLDRVTQAAEAAEAADGTPAGAEAESEEVSEELREAARILQLDIGELYAASEILGGEEFEQSDDPEIRTVYQRILELNVAQKAVMAMRGGREERMILVRDTNKLVALGVLRNPRIVEDDVESISRMRNITQDVLRQIGQSREWTKSYTIIAALVNNPRTPQGISTNFVPRLQNQDLKRLAANKDVPELIRRMAKRTLGIRTQRTPSRIKKH
jgi:hypothetical protein